MSEAYKRGHERAFGNTPIQRGSWVWCRRRKCLVERGEQLPSDGDGYAVIHGDIDSFVSPIDGSVIDDRAKLRAHNKRHGVTDPRDYGADWFERKGKENYNKAIGNTKEARRERVELIQQVLHAKGVR